jgi:DNA-binding transcriptional ArsR family regulator
MSDPLSATLAALADPTRRGIIARLTRGDATPTELAEPYAMSLAAISKHLKVLERAGLVSRTRASQTRPCHLEATPLQDLSNWVGEYRRFWENNLDQLDDYLTQLQTPDPTKPNN